jgi:hypothetical protein
MQRKEDWEVLAVPRLCELYPGICMFYFGYFLGVRSIFKGWISQPLKMDLTEGSETSAKLNLTPGKFTPWP